MIKFDAKYMKKRKICIVTGSRAEYGLLYWIMKYIKEDKDLILQIVATNMHLSPEFGLTYKKIENDGFVINKKIEMLLSSDTPTGISKSLGLGIIGCADAFNDLQPDIIVVLGDRYEIIAACLAALPAQIPVCHIHGGESTEGLLDEQIRNAVTKLSHIHFTSTEYYRKKVIQMGEIPDKVFCVGAPGLDIIKKTKLIARNKIEQELKFKFGKKNVLIIYHPVTLEKNTSKEQIQNIIEAVNTLPETKLFFSMPNADTFNRPIIESINDYVARHKDKSLSFYSLGSKLFLSLLSYVDLVIGNSSSAIIEVPSFGIPSINIGDRQKNRLMPDSVISCKPEKGAIVNAIKKSELKTFRKNIMNLKNPYGGDGKTSIKIVSILKTIDLKNLVKKHFYIHTIK